VSRHLITLYSDQDRARARTYVNSAPIGTRVEFKALKRSLPQNDLMWAMLTDVAAQRLHGGRKYTPDQWKLLFLHAIGREVSFIPSLDGKTFIPWGQSSSDLSREEMSNLIDFVDAWCAQNDVKLHGPHEAISA
jgi:hypothetical protein